MSPLLKRPSSNQIGMMYSGDLRLAECAHKTMAQLATQCIKIASYFDGSPKASVAEHAASQDWHAWIKTELVVRLFHCAWVRIFHLYNTLIEAELGSV